MQNYILSHDRSCEHSPREIIARKRNSFGISTFFAKIQGKYV